MVRETTMPQEYHLYLNPWPITGLLGLALLVIAGARLWGMKSTPQGERWMKHGLPACCAFFVAVMSFIVSGELKRLYEKALADGLKYGYADLTGAASWPIAILAIALAGALCGFAVLQLAERRAFWAAQGFTATMVAAISASHLVQRATEYYSVRDYMAGVTTIMWWLGGLVLLVTLATGSIVGIRRLRARRRRGPVATATPLEGRTKAG